MKPIEFLLDFDSTCCTHDFPHIGKSIGAEQVLKVLVENGHKIILFTMRSDNNNYVNPDGSIDNQGLSEAVRWFQKRNIPLYGIQTNPTQHEWTSSPKPYSQKIIDDTCLGIPLKYEPSMSSRPFVDWEALLPLLEECGMITPEQAEKLADELNEFWTTPFNDFDF